MKTNINMEDNINESNEKLNKMNILVSGKTGVGKSTLINAIFNEELTKTGIGKPVTEYIEQISNDNNYISLFDTVGINIKNYKEVFENLENFIKEKNSDSDENNHIHLAWICISEGSSRIEDMEINLEMLLSKYIPTIIVITKSFYESELLEEMKKICPNAKSIIPINSKEIKLNNMITVKQKNLDKLIEYSEKIVLNSGNNYSSNYNSNNMEIINEDNNKNNLILNENKNFEKNLHNERNNTISENMVNINSQNSLEQIKIKSKIIIENYSKVMATLLAVEDDILKEKFIKLKDEIENNTKEDIKILFEIKLKEVKNNQHQYNKNTKNEDKDNINNILNLIPAINLNPDKYDDLLNFYKENINFLYNIINNNENEKEKNYSLKNKNKSVENKDTLNKRISMKGIKKI